MKREVVNLALANKGLLVVLSAPSGGGKDTVLAELKKRGLNIKQSISATTRAPREGEKDGVDYWFISQDDFKKKISEDYFLEYVNYGTNFYGTPRKAVEQLIDSGYNVFLKIEVEGGSNIKRLFPDAVLVFITPPSFETLKSRLISRGTETEADLERRFEIARKEYERASEYDYVVINDSLEQCADDICSILVAEKYRYGRMKSFVDNI